MAKLTREDVLKLAQLARLKLTDAELSNFAAEITSILDYVEQLNNVDISGLRPTNQVTGLANAWREDKCVDYGYDLDELLKNVPNVKGRYIQVGRMI